MIPYLGWYCLCPKMSIETIGISDVNREVTMYHSIRAFLCKYKECFDSRLKLYILISLSDIRLEVFDFKTMASTPDQYDWVKKADGAYERNLDPIEHMMVS
jgi:hypothetical protein